MLRGGEGRWSKSNPADMPITTVAGGENLCSQGGKHVERVNIGCFIGLLIRYLFLEKSEQRSRLRAQKNVEIGHICAIGWTPM